MPKTIEEKLDLTLRGLHLLIRASFAPNDKQAQMKHFVSLQSDIGPWLKDYADNFGAGSEPGQPDSN